jgi:hypothetical protein
MVLVPAPSNFSSGMSRVALRASLWRMSSSANTPGGVLLFAAREDFEAFESPRVQGRILRRDRTEYAGSRATDGSWPARIFDGRDLVFGSIF